MDCGFFCLELTLEERNKQIVFYFQIKTVMFKLKKYN